MARAALIRLGDGFAGRIVPGEGEVVFWIHGYTLDSACWAGLWSLLPDWQHLGMDLPGHGNSLPLRRDEDLSTLARKIGALAMDRKARHLVALSFGSVLALQIALEYPGNFATLTLGSPIIGGGPFEPDIFTRYDELKTLFAETGSRPQVRDRWMGAGSIIFRGTESRPEFRDQIRRQVSRHPWWELVDDSYSRLWQSPQLFKELRRITAATLLIMGGEDCGAVKQCTGFLEQVIPRCRRRDLSGLSHLCLLEEPACVQPIIEKHWRAYPKSADVIREGTYKHAATH